MDSFTHVSTFLDFQENFIEINILIKMIIKMIHRDTTKK